MKTVNVKTTSVLISILLHTEDCVYRAVSKRCLFSLRVKKKKPVIAFKKKVNKDTTIVLEVCGLWMPTTFPRVGSGGKEPGDTNRDPDCDRWLVVLCGLKTSPGVELTRELYVMLQTYRETGAWPSDAGRPHHPGEGLGQRVN